MSARPPSHDEPTLVGENTAGGRVDEQRPLRKGDSLGRYVILSLLGTGGMGAVYAAYDPELDRKVAIKLLRARGGGQSSSLSGGSARLLREAQAMARLNHPNVITVHDVGTFDDQVFVAMEFVDGGTLSDWLEQPREFDEILHVFVAAGRGLEAAHAAGLIHRDFKPDNVLIHGDGRVAVADFGLARSEKAVASQPDKLLATEDDHAGADGDQLVSAGTFDERLTMTGALVGTPAYMAPEQHLHDEVTARSDQFSFCVALYEAVYRQRPFAGETLAALAFQVCQGQVRDPPSNLAPGWFRGVVTRGLARDPSQRHPDMATMLTALERLPGRRRRVMLAGGAFAALVAGVAGVYVGVAGEDSTCDAAEQALVGIWDDARRDEIEAALRQTEVAYVEDVWRGVSGGLDAYAENYIASQRDACEATLVRGEQSDAMFDRRMACLAHRRRALEQTLTILAQPDESVVPKAHDMVAGLPSLGLCSDIDALGARVAPPDTPELARQVDAIADELARVEALRGAGKLPEALEVAQAALPRAQEVDYLPIQAEATFQLGMALSAQEQDATELLLEAASLSIRSGHDEVFVRTALDLVNHFSTRVERFEEATQWLMLADATLQRMGEVPYLRGTYLRVKANSLREQGRFDESAAASEAAIELYTTQLPDSPGLASAYGARSTIMYEKGELTEARTWMRRAHEAARDRYGPDHPTVVSRQSNVAVLSMMMGEQLIALDELRDVVERKRRLYGADNLATVDAVSNLGLLLLDLREYEEAEASLREVLAAYEKAFPEGNTDVGECHANLADALERQDEHDEAKKHLIRALELFEAAEGRKWRWGLTGTSLGRIEARQGEVQTGLARAREGLALVAATHGEDSPRVAKFAVEIAEVELEVGERGPAVERLERALGSLAEGGDPIMHARGLWMLGRNLPDDPQRSAELLARARSTVDAAPEGPLKDDLLADMRRAP